MSGAWKIRSGFVDYKPILYKHENDSRKYVDCVRETQKTDCVVCQCLVCNAESFTCGAIVFIVFSHVYIELNL